jgi:predicted transcriptional regulator
MEVLWRQHPLTAEEMVAALAEAQQWQEATIKTLLNRLLNKGAIAAEKEGRRYLYTPVLRREDWVLEESQGLLKRLFDGRVAPLVAHFSRHCKLSRKASPRPRRS